MATTAGLGPAASKDVKLNVSTGIAPPTMRPGPAPSGTPLIHSLYAQSRWLVLRPCGKVQSGEGLAATER